MTYKLANGFYIDFRLLLVLFSKAYSNYLISTTIIVILSGNTTHRNIGSPVANTHDRHTIPPVPPECTYHIVRVCQDQGNHRLSETLNGLACPAEFAGRERSCCIVGFLLFRPISCHCTTLSTGRSVVAA
uniref:uncharacterized protein LOC125906912 n=1 Tax=Anopheles coluzzii TaxID=1518534 RepID=UPI0020FF9BD5|nr:uncharacterized protein LOC125906912 [Anopheles coluzzii]